MRLGILAALLSLVGCIRPSKVVGVACDSASDCVLGSVMGTCESTGFCSYPDADCASGSRYSPGAGMGLGGTCVGGTSGCGGQGDSCCGNVCGANLACDDTSKTCVCGANGQPCCGGDTCDANVACVEGAMCACGGIGQPCCGGTSCDAGVTCSAGTCVAGATQIAVGMGHACALRPDHTVWCWGNDWKPYPGSTPGLTTPTIGTSTPRRIENATDVVEIRASEMHTCGRKMDGTLWCWGHNESGQLGNGTNTSSRIAVQVSGLSNVTLFDGGRHHTCAVGTYNGVQGMFCWGRNSTGDHANGMPDQNLGRLGNNDVVDSNVPVPVDMSMAASAGQTVRSLSTGSYHSCIAMSDNKVWCWGRGDSGQLGNGTTASTKVPVEVSFAGVTLNGATVDEISCSDGSGFYGGESCMRTSTGAVYCWGLGNAMGDGTTTQRSAPTAAVTTTALGSATFKQLASTTGVVCGLTTAGDVWCWGGNRQGLLGINDPAYATSSTTPGQTTALSGATQVDMSHRTACAVDNQQQVWCWGSNRRGQARTPSTYLPQPAKVPL